MSDDKSGHPAESVEARTKEMRVLVMGMGRTGTTGKSLKQFWPSQVAGLIEPREALADGLRQLGFTPYDYLDRFDRDHLRLWDDAMKAKFNGLGKPWGRQEFDELTGDFDVRERLLISEMC